MKLVLICGAGAVGKMTVGQELAKITDLRLYHNHMDIEIVIDIFGTFAGNVIERIREVIFEEFSKTDHYGMIFTFMWAFDHQRDWEYINHLADIFRNKDAEVCWVELVASQEIRLQRNATENRLINKASKRNLEISNARLIQEDTNYRLVSNDGEIPYENYMKIDNSNLPPDVAAKMIKENFGLQEADKRRHTC